jgi:hypothetical protein
MDVGLEGSGDSGHALGTRAPKLCGKRSPAEEPKNIKDSVGMEVAMCCPGRIPLAFSWLANPFALPNPLHLADDRFRFR